MVTHLKELSEDEKIRQQCAARDDYERRLIGEYNRGERDGREAGKEIGEKIGKEIGRLEDIKNIMKSLNCTADKAMDILLIEDEDRALLIEKL